MACLRAAIIAYNNSAEMTDQEISKDAFAIISSHVRSSSRLSPFRASTTCFERVGYGNRTIFEKSG